MDELVDPPLVSQFGFCGCQHVTAANREHCLQSIERSGPAQGEGFAQFFASKIWNHHGDANCRFVYYKEFFDTVCRANNPNDPAICQPTTVGQQVGINTLPPFSVSCGQPFKWRNNHCPMSELAEMGTEMDWMRFLWNLNTVGSLLSPMTDIWQIYRHACNPGSTGNTNPGNCSDHQFASDELSWRERPVRPASGEPACRTNADCGDLPLRQTCIDAMPGSPFPCNELTPSCVCKLPAVGGFLQGAERLYVNDAAREQNVFDLGRTFGVSEDLTQ
jgi:hypothetical protein